MQYYEILKIILYRLVMKFCFKLLLKKPLLLMVH